MPFKGFSTAKVAKQIGCHPNTVRLYESWGLISPAERTPSGYRLFTETHIAQMRLARLVMSSPWVGREIRRASIAVTKLAGSGDLPGARAAAQRHLDIVRQERDQAEAAAEVFHRWAERRFEGQGELSLQIRDAARLLHVTPDTLRNWERNGLLEVPRNPDNRYRIYGRAEIDRARVIRLLVRSGFSLMAVLRALTFLEQGREGDVVLVLDTPMPGEDIFTAADRWLSSLDEQERRGEQMAALVEEIQRTLH